MIRCLDPLLVRISACCDLDVSLYEDRQLLVDISTLVRRDDKSGIQRVVWNILRCLLDAPPRSLLVRPVYRNGSRYRYAACFTRKHFPGQPGGPDGPVHFGRNDIFLGLDLDDRLSSGAVRFLLKKQKMGLRIYFIVHDLLPLSHPEWFVEGHAKVLGRWFRRISTVADGLICVSKSVAEDLATWLQDHPPARSRTLHIGYSHNGADFGLNGKDDISEGEQLLLEWFADRAIILMVGTLDPRKGHDQALAALESLWRAGRDILLVIVGKQGWKVDRMADRLRTHPEDGIHLFWFEKAGDAFLRQLYQVATVLLMASRGEGFGLPIIEAARHGLPVIARDLPVFREIAADQVFYFQGNDGNSLAQALESWLALYRQDRHPRSNAVSWLTWEQSTENLLRIIIEQQWTKAWHPEQAGNRG